VCKSFIGDEIPLNLDDNRYLLIISLLYLMGRFLPANYINIPLTVMGSGIKEEEFATLLFGSPLFLFL
jgi:hypothetical protein